MATEQDIANEYRKMMEHLRKPAGQSGVVKSITGTVAKVQLTSYEDGVTVDVDLTATASGVSGVVIYPAVSSDVVVVDVDGAGTYVIVQYSTITKTVVKMAGTEELVVTSGQIVMNGGANGGVPISLNVANKIAAIEADSNSQKAALIALIGAIGATGLVALTGTSLAALMTTALATNNAALLMPLTTAANLKNDAVKH